MSRSKAIVTSHGALCRVRFSFISLLKFMTLVGFSAGVLSLPLLLIAQADKLSQNSSWFITALLISVAAPLVGALNGIIYAVLGYPLYRWITARVDLHTYSGAFDLLKRGDDREI